MGERSYYLALEDGDGNVLGEWDEVQDDCPTKQELLDLITDYEKQVDQAESENESENESEDKSEDKSK